MGPVFQSKAIAASVLLATSLPGAVEAADLLVRYGDEKKTFSREDLEALGTATLKTSTPWTDGVVTFDVVAAAAMLDAATSGGDADFVQVHALDGYSVEMRAEEFEDDQFFIAIGMNGDPLPPNAFGPFWMIYDYDNTPSDMMAVRRTRSVWQVEEITLVSDSLDTAE